MAGTGTTGRAGTGPLRVRCTYCGGRGDGGALVEVDLRGVRYDYCDAACATAHWQAVELTDREREILDLVARGLTNAAIARRLVVSDKTVRNHVSNVFAKLHVADRAEAVARARDAGMGAGPL